MSNQSKRKKMEAKKLKATRPLVQSTSATGINKVQNEKPPNPETKKEPNDDGRKLLSWPSVKAALLGLFIWASGAILNYFGSNPRILYLPAIAFCCLICGFVLFETH